jgi:predicted  nucleic acid-binding Zn-ribbon protein
VIGLDTLKQERDDLKKKLAEVEVESKELDAKVRQVRQREIQTKREIEALSVLIELQETKSEE